MAITTYLPFNKIKGKGGRFVGGVYLICNKITGKKYIGHARHLHSRLRNHFYLLREGRHYADNMQSDFNSYGEESFIVRILYAEYGEGFLYNVNHIRKELEQEYIRIASPSYNKKLY